MSVDNYIEARNSNARNLSVAAQSLLHFFVGLWIFSGSFVLIEPSPYEFLFLIVIAISVIANVGLHKNNITLFLLFLAFIPFALIAAFQVNLGTYEKALMYSIITIFMLFQSFFLANYVADAPFERMRTIMRAYIFSAIIAALIGTLAYLKIMPGEEIFTLYGRARGLFKDPNVFGPFLILPAMFLLQRILLNNSRKSFWYAILFTILSIGVFASFSRGAWGYLLVSSLILFSLIFWLEACAKQKARMILIAFAFILLGAVALFGLLQIPEVKELFSQRFIVVQAYDAGEAGRFGRQQYAMELAIEYPLGIGAEEFARLRIGEAPHNTYFNIFHAYGWGGGLALFVLIFLTLKRGIMHLSRHSPNRLLMIPLISVFIPLVIEAAIIDVDHWRQFYLIVGLIWGVSAGYGKVSSKQTRRKSVYL